jgi:hypothetical protein
MLFFASALDAFRFYETGAIASSPPLANQNTNYTATVSGNFLFHLRWRWQETGGDSTGSATLQPQVRKNGGAWQDITTSSTIVQFYDDPAQSNNIAISTANFRLTGGTGTATEGAYADTTTLSRGLSASSYKEFVWSLQIVAADVANGDTLDFRWLYAGLTFPYTFTPRITVNITTGPEHLYKGAGNRASHYKGAAINDTGRYFGTKAGIYAT